MQIHTLNLTSSVNHSNFRGVPDTCQKGVKLTFELLSFPSFCSRLNMLPFSLVGVEKAQADVFGRKRNKTSSDADPCPEPTVLLA